MAERIDLVAISAMKLLHDDNFKAASNLLIEKEMEGFENVPDWFFVSCKYTANLLSDLRNVLLAHHGLLSDDEANAFLAKFEKEKTSFEKWVK